MPKKRTSMSVTKVPCTCRYLHYAAAEPTIPIVFDEELGEYHITDWRLEYTKSSEAANLEVTVYGPADIRFSLSAKYIGRPKG